MTSATVTPPAVSPSELLRTVAHEIRQPLSTIESIAYYLSLILPRDGGKVQEQLARLQGLVEQSNWILSSSLQLSDESPAVPVALDLDTLITESTSARPASIEIPTRLDLAGNLPAVRLDPGLGRALIENMLMLFRQLATAANPMTLRTGRQENGVSLAIETATPGYRSEASLGAGSALSLDSARRIVEAHGGSLELSVDPASGIRLNMFLP